MEFALRSQDQVDMRTCLLPSNAGDKAGVGDVYESADDVILQLNSFATSSEEHDQENGIPQLKIMKHN